MARLPSPVAGAGLVLGAILGLVPIFFADATPLTVGGAVFLGAIFLFALAPYAVFARVQRDWSRPLAVMVLVLLGVAHVAATILLAGALDEDALTSIGFLTIPPLLAAAVAVVALVVSLARAVGRRRRSAGS